MIALLATSSVAFADGRNFNDGPVVNFSAIRTLDGHFDDDRRWLATGWKKQEEAAKKAGLILSYRVLAAEPRGPNDPDIYRVIEYKNWAALEGLGGKLDSLTAAAEGIDKANQAVRRARHDPHDHRLADHAGSPAEVRSGQARRADSGASGRSGPCDPLTAP